MATLPSHNLVSKASSSGLNYNVIKCSAQEHYLTAGTGNYLLFGSQGDDTLIGGSGNNILIGGKGNNTLIAGEGNQRLQGGSGNDTLIGGTGDHMLCGGEGNNTLRAGQGNQHLIAGSGNDILVAGVGNDTLTGGGGFDQFLFNAPNQGISNITDFNQAEGDKILISADSFGGGLSIGTLDASEFTIGSAATNTSERIIYNSSTGALYFDADGSGSQAQVQFATLTTGLNLTNNDFGAFV